MDLYCRAYTYRYGTLQAKECGYAYKVFVNIKFAKPHRSEKCSFLFLWIASHDNTSFQQTTVVLKKTNL